MKHSITGRLRIPFNTLFTASTLFDVKVLYLGHGSLSLHGGGHCALDAHDLPTKHPLTYSIQGRSMSV
uniref:AlNc14C27G2634 protein n=1 Tax=Albugo laibachii Nc14 TaxID=890382 RepID=F0W701_9STRA|nr:AlNc14C27G2634 [Albugo laibachii Nc14]|eukprot:CCA16896.1 AlNc14C27G2634 [Albugo laibachii Nc14]